MGILPISQVPTLLSLSIVPYIGTLITNITIGDDNRRLGKRGGGGD